MPFEFEAEEHFLKNLLGSDIEPIAQVPEEGGHHHHDHGGLDPHIWHDPHNIIKMGEDKKNVFNEKYKKTIGKPIFFNIKFFRKLFIPWENCVGGPPGRP